MKLQTKVIGILIISILVSAAFPAVSIYQFYDLNNDIYTLLTKNVSDVVTIDGLNTALIRYDSHINKFVATDNKAWFEESKKEKERIQEKVATLIKTNAAQPDILKPLSEIRTLTEEYFVKVEKTVAVEDKNRQNLLRTLNEEYNARFISIQNTSAKLVESKSNQLLKATGEVDNKFKLVSNIAIGMGIIFLPLLIGLAVYLYRSTASPINRMSNLIKEVRTNQSETMDKMIDELDGFARSRSTDDELARLARTMRGLGLEVKEKTAELNNLVITDEKTKLFNFRHFKSEMAGEFVRAKRFEEPVSIIMIDVDKFKHYNDTNGHLLGDEVLIKVSRIIRDECRETDKPARFGGEEFAVLLPRTDKEEAAQVAERIRRAIEDAVFVNQEKQPNGNLTASLGVATFPHDAPEGDALIEAADSALYKSKENGRNRVTAFVNLEGLV